MKEIKPLVNRGILLKGNTRKIASPEGILLLNFLRSLMTASLPLMKSVINPLAKSLFIPLELSSGMSAVDATVQKKIWGSVTTALIISNQEMEDVMKIVKLLEESGLLIKRISETSESKVKKEKKWTSCNVIRNVSCLYVKKYISRKRSNKSGWRSNKSRWKFLIPTHLLTNFEIQKYYQNEPKFDVYSRNNVTKIKDAAYVINLDEYESIGAHWIALYVNAENVTYFDNFGVNVVMNIKKI